LIIIITGDDMIQGRPPKFEEKMIRSSVSLEPGVMRWLNTKGFGNRSETVNNLCREQMKIENWVDEKIEEIAKPTTENLVEEKQNYDEEISDKNEQVGTGEQTS
jgi:metal-responsive CopG/Arc/MetJ family transcriptional regulator